MRARIAIVVTATVLVGGCGGGHEATPRPHGAVARALRDLDPIVWAMPTSQLRQLPSSPGLRLLDRMRVVGRTKWDDYYGVVLLEYLKQKRHIDLLGSRFDGVAKQVLERHDVTLFFFTAEHRRRYGRRLARLNPPDRELRRYYEAFTEEPDVHAGVAMRAALTAIRNGVAAADSRTVGVLEVLD